MPIYEYECEACHHRVEIIQRFSDKPLKKCAACGGPLHKVLSPPALVFKGTGWYVTDYARAGQSKGDGGNGAGTKAETAGTKSEAKPATETKTETKKD